MITCVVVTLVQEADEDDIAALAAALLRVRATWRETFTAYVCQRREGPGSGLGRKRRRLLPRPDWPAACLGFLVVLHKACSEDGCGGKRKPARKRLDRTFETTFNERMDDCYTR